MNVRDKVFELMGGDIGPTIFIPGHDDAIIGIADRMGIETVVAYDREKIIQKLMTRDNMTSEGAEEYFDFNIGQTWQGDRTPVFITKVS